MVGGWAGDGYDGVHVFAPDGTLWVTSDEGSDFQRLGTLDVKTGKFTPRSPEPKWDVDAFDIAPDGSFIAYVVNEAGISKLKLLDPKTGAVREVTGLPKGVIGGMKIDMRDSVENEWLCLQLAGVGPGRAALAADQDHREAGSAQALLATLGNSFGDLLAQAGGDRFAVD